MTELVSATTGLYKKCWLSCHQHTSFFDSPLDHTQHCTGLPGCCKFPSFQP